MALVKYPGYINAERERIKTNDAVMGLLVGSKLASRTLELTDGSSVTLSTMFPKVQHVHRFDLRADTAREILNDSESLLGSMAVLYTFGLHEDLLREMLTMLSSEPGVTAFKPRNVNSEELHAKFADITGISFASEELELFNVLRLMRNARIHNGGRAKKALSEALEVLSTDASSLWRDVTGQEPPMYQEKAEIKIGLSELILILAVTKRLAEAANIGLQGAISRPSWLTILKEHLSDEVRLIGNSNQLLRKCAGFARTYYAPLKFDSAELQTIL